MTKAAHDTTARARRLALKEDLARVFLRSLSAHDVDQCDVSAATAVGPSMVQRWTSKRETVKPGLVDAVLAADADRRVALDLIGWAAEKLGARIVEAVDTTAAELLGALAKSVSKSGDAHSEVMRALADGKISDDELRAIRERARDGVNALSAIEHAAQSEIERRNPRTWESRA